MQQKKDMGEEILDLRTKYAINLEDRKRLGRIRDFFQRDLLRSNPGMTSVKFREALEELKRRTMGRDENENEDENGSEERVWQKCQSKQGEAMVLTWIGRKCHHKRSEMIPAK